jgi:hypothetical protein
MSWAGCYDLTLTCDSDAHRHEPQEMHSRTFTDEHGSKCRARARKAGWTWWPDGRALCPMHKDERVTTWRPR